MNVLWSRERGTVGEVVDALDESPRPAYNTVLTMLRILERKGVRHARVVRTCACLRAGCGSRCCQAARGFSSAVAFLRRVAGVARPQSAGTRCARRGRSAARARPDRPRRSVAREVTTMTLLATWLWQGVLVAAATIAVLHFATRLNAASRYALSWAGLCAVLLLPIPSILASLASSYPAIGDRRSRRACGGTAGRRTAGLARVCRGRRVDGNRDSCRPSSGAEPENYRSSSGGIAPMPAERQARLRHWAQVSSHGRRAELRVSPDVTGACVMGLRQPMVVVSEGLCAALTDDDLDRIVIHEYAHLARYDDWAMLAQAAIETVAGFHPAVRWLFRQVDLEREAACDNRVVTLTGDARPYAACLTTVAGSARYRRLDDALMPSAMRTRSTLHARVVRLLDSTRRRGDNVEHRLVWPMAAVLALGVLVASQMSPLVVLLQADAGVAIGVAVLPRPARSSLDVTPNAGMTAQGLASRAERHVGGRAISDSEDAGRHFEGESTTCSTLRRRQRPARAAREPFHHPHPQKSRRCRQRHCARPPLDYRRLLLQCSNCRVETVAAPCAALKASDASGPWVTTGQRAAAAGVAAGTGAKRAGTSIAGFFTRAGKALAQSF